MPATIRQPVSSICRITTLLRRPLKREDVKRKLIAHKNCIHEIGQDMPEILNRKRHLPEKVYTFHKKNFDYPEKTLKYKHIRRISD